MTPRGLPKGWPNPLAKRATISDAAETSSRLSTKSDKRFVGADDYPEGSGLDCASDDRRERCANAGKEFRAEVRAGENCPGNISNDNINHSAKMVGVVMGFIDRKRSEFDRAAYEADLAERDRRTLERGAMMARKAFPFGNLHRESRFETYRAFRHEQREMVDAVVTLVANAADRKRLDRPWLILAGNPGTGKTHMLAAAYWWLAEHATADQITDTANRALPTVAITNELIQQVTADMYATRQRGDDAGPASIRSAVQRRLRGPLVILDDYGVATPIVTAQSETQQEIGYTLFDLLYTGVRPLLLATNLPIEKPARGGKYLAAVMGARAWDRALQHATIIRCDWQSYRSRTQEAML